MKPLQIFTLLALSSSLGHAAIIADIPAQHAEVHMAFTRIGPASPPTSLGLPWIISFGTDHVDIGDRLRFSIHEDTILDDPIYTFTFDGTRSLNGIVGFIPPTAYFQDGQGVVAFDLYSGSVEVDHLSFQTHINGDRYHYSMNPMLTLTPEPTRALLGFLGLAAVLVRRRR